MITPFAYSEVAQSSSMCRVILDIITYDPEAFARWSALSPEYYYPPSDIERRLTAGVLPFSIPGFTGEWEYDRLPPIERGFIDMLVTLFHKNLDNILKHIFLSTSSHRAFHDLFVLLEIPYFRLTVDEFNKHKKTIFKIIDEMLANDSLMRRIADQADVKLKVASNIHPPGLTERLNRCYHKLLLQAFAKEFMTGEFTWRVHNGLTRSITFFGKVKTTQIVTFTPDEAEDTQYFL